MESFKSNILGVDYYPEQWDFEMLEKDLDTIVELGANTIRIGEFAWHIMEPEEGRYEFEYFDDVIARAKERGLNIIFGTPTATMPAWVYKKYPSCALSFINGERCSFGGRRVYCFNSKTYRELTVKIVSALVNHYKDEKAIIAWQIDNEFGHEGSDDCYCESCTDAFREFLKDKYKTISELNDRWGTVFWNLTYNSFDEIPTPKSTIAAHNPSFRLDWARFRSFSAESYIKLQYDILRKSLPADVSVIHDFSGGGFDKSIDFSKMAHHIDVVAYNNYPVWGGQREPIPPHEIACGLDYMRGLKGESFYITEAIMGAQGHDVIGYLPRPNQAKLWSYQAVMHGASAIIYFRFREAVKGAEQFCYGIIDSTNEKKRKFYEVQNFFKHMSENPELMSSSVKSKVALVYDYDSLASFRIQRQSEAFDNKQGIYRLYKPFYARNVSIDVISSDKDFSTYSVVVLPHLIIYKEDVLKRLRQFAENGGTVILGFRSALKDIDNNLVLGQKIPIYTTDFIGGYVEEIEALAQGVTVPLIAQDGKKTTGSVFRDMLKTTTAKQLYRYDDEFFNEYAAVTLNHYGSGKVYYLGTAMAEAELQSLTDTVLSESGIEYTITPEGVELCKKYFNEKLITAVINHNGQSVSFEDKTIEPYGVLYSS